MQTVIIIVGVVLVLSVVAFVVYRLIYSLIYRRKIIKDGIQVEAVLQRVEKHESIDIDNDGNTSSTYTFWVTYTNDSGQKVDAMLLNGKRTMQIGEHLSVKYLPNRPDLVMNIRNEKG